jgi:hypothetical protein
LLELEHNYGENNNHKNELIDLESLYTKSFANLTLGSYIIGRE